MRSNVLIQTTKQRVSLLRWQREKRAWKLLAIYGWRPHRWQLPVIKQRLQAHDQRLLSARESPVQGDGARGNTRRASACIGRQTTGAPGRDATTTGGPMVLAQRLRWASALATKTNKRIQHVHSKWHIFDGTYLSVYWSWHNAWLLLSASSNAQTTQITPTKDCLCVLVYLFETSDDGPAVWIIAG